MYSTSVSFITQSHDFICSTVALQAARVPTYGRTFRYLHSERGTVLDPGGTLDPVLDPSLKTQTGIVGSV